MTIKVLYSELVTMVVSMLVSQTTTFKTQALLSMHLKPK